MADVIKGQEAALPTLAFEIEILAATPASAANGCRRWKSAHPRRMAEPGSHGLSPLRFCAAVFFRGARRSSLEAAASPPTTLPTPTTVNASELADTFTAHIQSHPDHRATKPVENSQHLAANVSLFAATPPPSLGPPNPGSSNASALCMLTRNHRHDPGVGTGATRSMV